MPSPNKFLVVSILLLFGVFGVALYTTSLIDIRPAPTELKGADDGQFAVDTPTRSTKLNAINAPASSENESQVPTHWWVLVASAVNSRYAESSGVISYDGVPIEGADPTTFMVSQGIHEANIHGRDTYAKDKNNVYFGEDGGLDVPPVSPGAYVVIGADPTTFQPIYDVAGYFTSWAKDKDRVYGGYVGESVFDSGIDPASFSVLASGEPPNPYDAFLRSNSAVYTMSGVVDGADPTTFVVIGSVPASGINHGPVYGKDMNHVFVSDELSPARVITGADPASFSIASSTSAGFDSFDKNHFYIDGRIVAP